MDQERPGLPRNPKPDLVHNRCTTCGPIPACTCKAKDLAGVRTNTKYAYSKRHPTERSLLVASELQFWLSANDARVNVHCLGIQFSRLGGTSRLVRDSGPTCKRESGHPKIFFALTSGPEAPIPNNVRMCHQKWASRAHPIRSSSCKEGSQAKEVEGTSSRLDAALGLKGRKAQNDELMSD